VDGKASSDGRGYYSAHPNGGYYEELIVVPFCYQMVRGLSRIPRDSSNYGEHIMPINDDGVVYMTRQDWITQRTRQEKRLLQLNMARVHIWKNN
jgi:hypothetical protein